MLCPPSCPLTLPLACPSLVSRDDDLTDQHNRAAAIIGCLLGTAVGDALGLSYEALSKPRQRRLYPTY